MKQKSLILIFFFLQGIFYSCNKTPLVQNSTEAHWIKVVSDSPVYFTGKIRSDAGNDLYCSYTYQETKFGSSSAILKMDENGNAIWRKEFEGMNIYDFVLNNDGDLIVASALHDTVMLIKVLSSDHSSTLIGSYELPYLGINIKAVEVMKILITSAGNYNLSGTMNLPSIQSTAGFTMEVGADGIEQWQHSYLFSQFAPAGTSITGCTQTSAGDYLLFGNVQFSVPAISKFFIMKCDGNGDTIWTRFYNTSSYDSSSNIYSGYYCGTSDIIADDAGNFYACAFNVLYNTPWQLPSPIYSSDDNSARIFKMNEAGDLLDSVRLKYDVQNQVADLVLKKDGGLFIGLNPNKLGNFNLVGERYSFVANVSSSFELEHVSSIQTQYTDYMGSVCVMNDGYAIETMIQSFGQEHYKLQVIQTDENGNF